MGTAERFFMLARTQLPNLNAKGSRLSFDIPTMCKICKTRSGHGIGGAGHGAAGGTNGTGRTEARSLNESRHFPLGMVGNMWMDKVSVRWDCRHNLPQGIL